MPKKKPRGRPRKPARQRRSVKFYLWITPAEYSEITRRAQLDGRSRADWLMRQALGTRLPAPS